MPFISCTAAVKTLFLGIVVLVTTTTTTTVHADANADADANANNEMAKKQREYSAERPIKVGWIDGMNSIAYKIDFQTALRKGQLDIDLNEPFALKFYGDGTPTMPDDAFYAAADVLVVSIEAQKTMALELGNTVMQQLEQHDKCVVVMHPAVEKPALVGEWKKKYACLVPKATSSSWSFAQMEWNAETRDTNSPLLQGVNSFQAGYKVKDVDVAPHCDLVASYADGTPLVAVHRQAKVAYLNFYPIRTVSGMTYYSEATDGDVLLRNVMYWCMMTKTATTTGGDKEEEAGQSDEL